MSKKLWICWFQGLKKLNKTSLHFKCIQKWVTLNPKWDITILDFDNIDDYAPEFFQVNEYSPKRSLTAQSDLLRLIILKKFGGIWVDATVYPVESLDNFIYDLLDSNSFFAYRFIYNNKHLAKPSEGKNFKEIATWFLCSLNPEELIFKLWLKNFLNLYMNTKTWSPLPANRQWDYFSLHYCFVDLYDNNKKINNLINNMTQVDQSAPHSAHFLGWKNKEASFMYKKPDFSK